MAALQRNSGPRSRAAKPFISTLDRMRAAFRYLLLPFSLTFPAALRYCLGMSTTLTSDDLARAQAAYTEAEPRIRERAAFRMRTLPLHARVEAIAEVEAFAW